MELIWYFIMSSRAGSQKGGRAAWGLPALEQALSVKKKEPCPSSVLRIPRPFSLRSLSSSAAPTALPSDDGRSENRSGASGATPSQRLHSKSKQWGSKSGCLKSHIQATM